MSPFVVSLILFTFNLPRHFNCYTLKFVPEYLQNPLLQVTLPQGTVQGKVKSTIGLKLQYYSFEGIPYAMPPVDDLRFKPPVPATSWNGVLNSTVMDVPSCVQVTPSIFNGFLESEDCLYINVFTPIEELQNATNAPLLPVMVWIYGGGFLLGTANASYFGPDNLLEENVIVVHFGYRLASFGFLSTEDLESPGNYGLKDQQLALRWVNDNIRFFGGDPNKTTIFGESAGAVSVQYQVMNPKNEGLFQGAISQSGSALCIWAYQRQPRKIAFDLGRAAGIRTDSSKELISYLRDISTEKLKAATMKASLRNSFGIINGIPFAPTIEPEHENAFLTGKGHQLLVEGHFLRVPYIIGFNSEEALEAYKPSSWFSDGSRVDVAIAADAFRKKLQVIPSGQVLLTIAGLRLKPEPEIGTGDNLSAAIVKSTYLEDVTFNAFNVVNPLLRFYDFDTSIWVPTGMNTEDATTEVGEEIRKFYFRTSKSRSGQYLEYINDGYFFRPIIESAKLFGLLTPTYMYTFTYEGLLGRRALGYFGVEDYRGVLHTEEMAYIWSRNDLPRPSNADRITKARMVRLWTNFAKTGNPTPEEDPYLGNTIWPTVSANMTYLDINRDLSIKQNFKGMSMAFWKYLYERYGAPPYDTY